MSMYKLPNNTIKQTFQLHFVSWAQLAHYFNSLKPSWVGPTASPSTLLHLFKKSLLFYHLFISRLGYVDHLVHILSMRRTILS